MSTIGQVEKTKPRQALLSKPANSLWRTSDFPGYRLRQIMRDVAGKYGIKLIDTENKLDETPRVYFDICHFDAEGHEIVGKLISEVLNDGN